MEFAAYKNVAAIAGVNLILALAVSPISAQEASIPAFAAQGVATGAALPTALMDSSHTQPEGGIPYGNWVLYPTIFVGAVYNDNVYQTPSNQTSAVGMRLTPSIEADQDNGLHKTTVYANSDAQLFPGHNANSGQTASTVSGRAGLSHLWAPTDDLSVHISGDFTRMDGAFGSTLAANSSVNSAASFVGSPTSMNVAGYRQFSDQTTGAVTVEDKLTNQIFVRSGLGVQQIIYERPPIGVSSSLNGIDYNAFGRFGFWISPLLNAFAETGGDLRRYSNAPLSDTNSYRVVGGLSSDLIGLFRGEIYGGFQKQFSTQNAFAPILAPTFGGKISYYPLPYLTIAASLDQGFGSATGSVGGVPGASSSTLQARLQADYEMFEYWRASVRAGFVETRYSDSQKLSDSLLAGAGVSYSFWRNMALTLDYQYTESASNGFGRASYPDNTVSIGVTYHY